MTAPSVVGLRAEYLKNTSQLAFSDLSGVDYSDGTADEHCAERWAADSGGVLNGRR